MVSRKREKWYQRTESMLYNYPSFEIRIRSLQAFIEEIKGYNIGLIDATPSGTVGAYGSIEGNSYTISSPVEKDVNHLIIRQVKLEAECRKKIETLRRWKEIVETSIDIMLDPDQRELVDMVYWKRLPWQKVCQEKLLDKNTFFYQRRDIVKILAWCFGYLDDTEAQEILGLFAEEGLWKCKVVNK